MALFMLLGLGFLVAAVIYAPLFIKCFAAFLLFMFIAGFCSEC